MEFEIVINAPKEKVWNTLWDDASYRKWTTPFSEDSRAETDWKQGSKVLFLDGKNDGMVSEIAEVVPHEFMSIKHLGSVKNGVEDVESEEAKQWAGAFENYKLTAVNEGTLLKVWMGGATIPPEFEGYLQDAWPKALDKLKGLSEQ